MILFYLPSTTPEYEYTNRILQGIVPVAIMMMWTNTQHCVNCENTLSRRTSTNLVHGYIEPSILFFRLTGLGQ